MPDAAPRYWAFLSYSHADIRWGRRLHRALEAYVVPRRLVGRPGPGGPTPRRLRPIFRDQDEMGAGGSLSDRLKTALDASASMIVVCSPAAAASPWVNEEIRRFKAERGEDRILAVIVDGEPFGSERPGAAALECFPPALRQRHADGERIEPIAADLRPGRDNLHAAVLKLVAGVLGVDLDELVRRDAQRRNRELVALTSVFAAATAAMAGLALVAVHERDQARLQRAEALRQRGQAEGLVEFMIGDLKDRLQPAGRLDIMDAIGVRAQAYYAAEKSGLDDRSLGRRATVLHLLGNIRTQRYDLPAALVLFQEAARSTAEILKRRPNDPRAIYDHAQSVFWIGEVARQSSDEEAALTQFRIYQSLARRLTAIDPKNLDWQAEVEEADTNVGVVLLSQARAEEASHELEGALAISRRLAAAPDAKRAWQWDEAQSFAWLADAEKAQGRLDIARTDRQAEGRVYEALMAASPHDSDAAAALANSHAETAGIELEGGGAAAATLALRDAAAQLDVLMRAAPDNAIYQSEALTAQRLLAEALLQQGRLKDAAVAAARATELCEARVEAAEARHDPAPAWRGPRLGGARIIALKVAAAGARSAAAQRQALQAAPGEAARLRGLLAAEPQSRILAVAAAEAELLAGDFADLQGDAAGARAAWSWSLSVLRAAPQARSWADPAPVVLRQATYRLSFAHPPAGPLSEPSRVRALPKGPRSLTDYRW